MTSSSSHAADNLIRMLSRALPAAPPELNLGKPVSNIKVGDFKINVHVVKRKRSSMEKLPVEVFERILMEIDQDDLCKNCLLVNRMWYSFVASKRFWRRYHDHWARKSGKKKTQLPREYFQIQDGLFSWKLAARIPAQNPVFEVNLLKNTQAELVEEKVVRAGPLNDRDLNVYPGWRVEWAGGKGWTVERPVKGDTIPHANNDEILALKPVGCFFSSHGMCAKSQVVDLVDQLGFPREILFDERLEFKVDVSEFFRPFGNCTYQLRLVLVSNELVVISVTDSTSESREFEEGIWGKARIIVTIGGAQRLRYIHVWHGSKGTDTIPPNDQDVVNEPRARSGVQMTGTSLKISYPVISEMSPINQILKTRFETFPIFKTSATPNRWTCSDNINPANLIRHRKKKTLKYSVDIERYTKPT